VAFGFEAVISRVEKINPILDKTKVTIELNQIFGTKHTRKFS